MKKLIIALGAFIVLFVGVAQAALPELPVTVAHRKALTGPGRVLMIETTVKEELPVLMTVRRDSTGVTLRKELYLSWKHKNEYGHLEGVSIFPGDEITLENTSYSPFVTRIPK